ncbi:SDR family NAD(P)-dependent oxidoreductase, partial [Streptomyces sp. NPDC002962]|uniref:SDR family NAD(P)-dependent oxidoreductase n=1 Tax=Streptomyces sp. NPDC002962 TaxID=3364674 RepID=UPI0036AD5B98
RGVEVDWASVLPGGRRVDLPTYAFQRKHYWLEPLDKPRHADDGDIARNAVDSQFWEAVESQNLDELARTLEPGANGAAAKVRSSLETVLPALASWRRQRREHSVVDSWRYRVAWRPLRSATAGAAALSGTWLVIAPAAHREHPWVTAATDALRDGGAEVRTVVLDAAEAERGAWTQELSATTTPAASGVLSLLALDETPLPRHPGVAAGLGATLTLLQALGDAGIEAPLWCATQGAVSVNSIDPGPHPLQAQVWGLGRVAGLETPQRWGGLLDLPETPDPRSAGRLCTAVADSGDEDQLALRGSGVFVRRLVRAPLDDRTTTRQWSPTGTALVTGGTGGLGAHVARWLAAQGAEHVVLTSRRGPEAEGADELRSQLEESGARVTIAACDMADRESVSELLDRLRREGSPVRTVVHAAGVPGRFVSLADAQLSDLAETLAAKATGAETLDELLGQDDEVDAFVLFSSNAGIWGGSGQGAYAAANAHLDALAERRRARGAAATSVAWGMWDGDGLANEQGMGEALSLRGLRAMDPALAITALHQALDRDETTLSVTDMDWERFVSLFTVTRPSPFLDELPEVRELSKAPETAEEESGSRSALERQLAGLPVAERHRALTELVQAQAATVLGHAKPDEVEPERGFLESGFGSLTAVELRNRLNEATGLRLPASTVYDHPTPAALARHLHAQLQPGEVGGEVDALEGLQRIEAAVLAAPADGGVRDRVAKRLRDLLRTMDAGAESQADGGLDRTTLESASDDEMFALIDKELGLD